MRENWNEQIKGDLGRAGYGLITYRAIRVKRGNSPPGHVDEGGKGCCIQVFVV